jgi:hypothetical protein
MTGMHRVGWAKAARSQVWGTKGCSALPTGYNRRWASKRRRLPENDLRKMHGVSGHIRIVPKTHDPMDLTTITGRSR